MSNPSLSQYLAKKIVERDVLSIGEFQLNSGTTSKFFYDFSKFSDSKGLVELGFVFSKTIQELQIPFDILLGTAYKGIIISLATSLYWHQFETNLKERNIPWAFDRKEPKKHGEKGSIIGTNIKDKRVLIVDDVFTSGKAMKRSIKTVLDDGAKDYEILVAVNRSEEIEPIQYLDGKRIHYITTHNDVLKEMK